MTRERRALSSTSWVVAIITLMGLAQVVAAPALDRAGWATDHRNPRANGWGTAEVVPLLDAAGGQLVLPAAEMRVVRDLLGPRDDVELGHGWWTRRRPSNPLQTTVDPDIQSTVAAVVAGRGAAVVVVSVADGTVLALAGDGETTPVTAAPPGSIFKLVLFGGALDAGVVERGTEFPIEASYAGVRNFGGTRCGGDLVEVIAASCNAAAQRVGARLGPIRLTDTARRWGFQDPARTVGFEPSFPTLTTADVAFTSAVIGQHDTRMSPLWAATMAAAVGSGGWLNPPAAVVDGETGSQVLDPDSAEALLAGMVRAVEGGTAVAARSDRVAVAAKTGTAESGLGYDHAWTVALAPARSPRIAIAVLVTGRTGASKVGGRDAAPLVAEVVDGLGGAVEGGPR